MLLDVLPGYAGLPLAMLSGLFGATFFMLLQLQGQFSQGSVIDIDSTWSWSFIMLRCLMGVGAAAILYFFFKTGLLQGTIWPKLDLLTFDMVSNAKGLRVPNANLALLIVWSFLAGYSQTFVPNLLKRTEARDVEK